MSDIKPWQIIVIVLAVGVLAFSGMKMMSGGPLKGPSGHMTVDILTGQLYLVQKGKAKGIVYPSKNPDTGERTLIPVRRQSDADPWKLDERFAARITKDIRNRSKALGDGMKIEILDTDPIVHVIK